jgi:hypothetical protein
MGAAVLPIATPTGHNSHVAVAASSVVVAAVTIMARRSSFCTATRNVQVLLDDMCIVLFFLVGWA